MRKVALVILLLLVATFYASAHPGGTDSNGGHNSSSGYHYHHGYPAHSHSHGCPYAYHDKTGYNSRSSSVKKSPSTTYGTPVSNIEHNAISNNIVSIYEEIKSLYTEKLLPILEWIFLIFVILITFLPYIFSFIKFLHSKNSKL